MKQHRLALSLAATALTLVALVWLLTGKLAAPVTPSPAAGPHGEIERTDTRSTESGLVSPAVEDPASNTREARPSLESEPPSATPEQVVDPHLPIPDSVFEAKYADLTDPDKAESLAAKIGRDISDKVRDLAKERDQAGIYETFPLEYSDDGKLLPLISAPEPFVYRKTISHRDEGLWHLVTLPEDEFPELYRLYEEKSWLMHHSMKLMSGGVPADGRHQSD